VEPNVNLLGRRPSTPDHRDFTVDMVSEASSLELAFQRLLAARGANPAVKAWAAEVMGVLVPQTPAPPPPPPPPPEQDVVWPLADPVLDQGDTPHCGGFGGSHWCNLEPVIGHLATSDAHALYYESVAIGGYPGTEDGVESRWVAKALQARGRLDTYAFAQSLDEIKAWVRTRGPVMMGTDWTYGMFNPDADGLVQVTGDMAGGHFWCVCGDLPELEQVLCLNSWGSGWGRGGFFRLGYTDLASLLVGLYYPGDAIVSPELAY
jgi:hypothetical protein